MSIGRLIGILAVQIALAACATEPALTRELVLNETTVQLDGWFSSRGEWTLFPSPSHRNYDPYTSDDSRRCVSLVNATGLQRSKFSDLDGRHVVVVGSARRYEDLSTGDSVADTLLSKRYFEGQPVEDSCLRDVVFIVSGIRAN